MTYVKICGITEPDAAAMAADLGATAIGLVFWPASPRFVDRTRARRILAALPPLVRAVGVFVDQVPEARSIAEDLGLSAVQFHGDEAPADYEGFPYPVIKAVAVRDAASKAAAAAVPARTTVLLDAHDPVKRGGTGVPIDWSVAAAIARDRRVILSGGLNADNVAAAIAAVRPYGIDVSSGVESAPGKKDRDKMRALFTAIDAAARQA
jgi:phosphoribosylanthranilate isomerase